MMRNAAITAALSLLFASPFSLALAATKCEVKTSPCIDARTGQARVCSTTICLNDKGEVVSINTIVAKEGGDKPGGRSPKGKMQLRDLTPGKKLDKASPN